MAELEAVIEKRLIDQLCSGESQWTYRPDIRTEEQLSPFMTPIDEEVARHKLELEQQQTKANTAFRIFTFILALCTAVGILVLIGLFVNMALKQGVLNDAGIMQGIFSAAQEVFRAIFTRNY
jgi:hypothetical protein